MPRDTHHVGVRVQVSMGIDAGRIGTIIPMLRVNLDSRGVPMLNSGHYHPISRKDRAVEYDNGTLDVQDKANLIVLE